MDTRSRAIILGAVVLLILGIVLAGFFYFGGLNRPSISLPSMNGNNALSELPTISPSEDDSGLVSSSDNTKLYSGEGFVVSYPRNWGILTCNNSQNFEFDPVNSTDSRGYKCDIAVKPITILVNSGQSCSGETVTLGSNQVSRSKTTNQNGEIDYNWCTTTAGKSFNITHRVSQTGSRATSQEDFSSQIEEMIGSIRFNPAGS